MSATVNVRRDESPEARLWRQLENANQQIGALREELRRVTVERDRAVQSSERRRIAIMRALESLDYHSRLNAALEDKDDEIVQCVFDTLEVAQ